MKDLLDALIMIVVFAGVFVLPFWLLNKLTKPKVVEQGKTIGKCISAYNEQTGNSFGVVSKGTGGSRGYLCNDFYITLEEEKGHRETYSINSLEFGKVKEGETVEVSWYKYKHGPYFIDKVERIINS